MPGDGVCVVAGSEALRPELRRNRGLTRSGGGGVEHRSHAVNDRRSAPFAAGPGPLAVPHLGPESGRGPVVNAGQENRGRA
jgi:hypothetical protein